MLGLQLKQKTSNSPSLSLSILNLMSSLYAQTACPDNDDDDDDTGLFCPGFKEREKIWKLQRKRVSVFLDVGVEKWPLQLFLSALSNNAFHSASTTNLGLSLSLSLHY